MAVRPQAHGRPRRPVSRLSGVRRARGDICARGRGRACGGTRSLTRHGGSGPGRAAKPVPAGPQAARHIGRRRPADACVCALPVVSGRAAQDRSVCSEEELRGASVRRCAPSQCDPLPDAPPTTPAMKQGVHLPHHTAHDSKRPPSSLRGGGDRRKCDFNAPRTLACSPPDLSGSPSG